MTPTHAELIEKLAGALKLSDAVFSLFTDTINGDISAADLAEMTNKAIELNAEALASYDEWKGER